MCDGCDCGDCGCGACCAECPPEIVLLFSGCMVGGGVAYKMASSGVEPKTAAGIGVGACVGTYVVEFAGCCLLAMCTESDCSLVRKTRALKETVRNRFNFSTSEAVPVLPISDASINTLQADVLYTAPYGTVTAPMGQPVVSGRSRNTNKESELQLQSPQMM